MGNYYINAHKLSICNFTYSNGPFAAELSHSTKSPNCRANDALRHVKQRKFKSGGFV